VHIWKISDGSEFATIRGHSSLVEHLAFSADGSRFLTASHDGTARLWDVDGLLTTSLFHKNPPTFAVLSPDGTRVRPEVRPRGPFSARHRGRRITARVTRL
jgi:WD40 repeat protein